MKRLLQFSIAIFACAGLAQTVELPPDFRQHTLTEYNSSFANPVFALDRNNPQSVAIWTRWQWQSIDGDPTTLLLNYTRRLNEESAAGAGFFQHNTGLYLQTGGVLNYAYALDLENSAQISFGLNLFAYQRQLADDRFIQDPDNILPLPPDSNDFIMQLAPGLQFRYSGFSIGIAAENLFDYNFTENEKVSDSTEKIYFGHVSYDVPISTFGSTEGSFIRPVVYLKSVPGFDNQFGINTLFSTTKFWVQAGYNNFYGISGGIGGRFFKKLSLGALVEAGTSSDLDGLDPSIELVAAFKIDPRTEKEEPIEPEEEEPEEIEEEITEQEKSEEELAAEAALALQLEEERRAEEARKAREQFVADSINAVRQAEEEAARKQAELAQQAEEEKPQAGEKYQEAVSENGIQPGFYLVANVFGTKRYYESFMKTLSDQGLEPKSFYRSENKYNYVYLGRYDTMREARRARDSQFNGRYKGETWIFRVVGN